MEKGNVIRNKTDLLNSIDSNETKIVVDLDLSSEDPQFWNKIKNAKDFHFLGCILPQESLALPNTYPQSSHLPFKQYRNSMYTQQELANVDSFIFQWHQSHKDLLSDHARALHDMTMKSALLHYIQGKFIVIVLGGHSMSRSSSRYRKVVLMCKKLAENGFVVASGGGPGAMEAANLGSYLQGKTEQEVEEVLEIMSHNEGFDHEYHNLTPVKKVIEKFGWAHDGPGITPSIGIPTFEYGQEPSNSFATWVCKFFSKAIRQDSLVEIANSAIFTPGSAGTRHEVFQAACRNYDGPETSFPMLFLDSEFWRENGIFEVVQKTSKGAAYHDMLLSTDDGNDIVQYLIQFRSNKQ